jgi:Holliday junction resolvase
VGMTPEGRVKRKAVAELKKLGMYIFFPATGGFGRSGVPDIVCCYKGKFIGIECKANGNKPTALQQSNLEEIVNNGGIAIVVDETSVFNLKQIIEETEL